MNMVENNFSYEINLQVLNLVCRVAREDQVLAQLIFGLPEGLVISLARLNVKQVESLSKTQLCLLTLRNCGDQAYWGKIIASSEACSEEHLLNLNFLSMMRIDTNTLFNTRGLSNASIT